VHAAGLELVGEPVWAAEAFGDPTLDELAWFFLRAPDGRVFAIEQVPDQLSCSASTERRAR
jgi:hypothetical protein